MKCIYILAAVLGLAACADPASSPAGASASTPNVVAKQNPDGSLDLHVSPARVAECAAQGGCSIFTRDQLVETMQWAADAASRKGKEAL